ncbi:MAG: molybdenum cofactor biosynthesis protein MoaE [Thermoanaerobaculia bacterium]
MSSRLTREPLEPDSLLAEVTDVSHGGVVSFVGVVRDNHGGRRVTGIEYTAYEPLAEPTLVRIEEEVGAGHRARVRIRHRLGDLVVGEASVAIAASAAHREAAFAACRETLERLKREAPIWKRERYADGSSAWREEEPINAPPVAGGGGSSSTERGRTGS